MNFLSKIKASYVFNIFAVALVGMSFVLYFYFSVTKEKIFLVNQKANIQYVASIADNLVADIIRIVEEDLAEALQEDEIIKSYIESDLKLFVTTKYQYIYILAKEKNIHGGFKILVDSSKTLEEKNSLYALYNVFNKEDFTQVYDSKSSVYLQDKNKRASYLKPIIVADKVVAIIVIEFTLEEQKNISLALQNLEDAFELVISFFVVIFIFMLWFSSVDSRREKEKKAVFEKLQTSNKKLKIQSEKVIELNNSLENRVKYEVEKNREKDVQMIQQSRLAQMGEMISMIAHQWRQPLSAISATSSAIVLKAEINTLEKENAIELAQKITEYSQHLSMTIDDFREFFKSNKKITQTSYTQLVESVLGIVETSLETKNIKLILQLELEDKFETYSNEIKQVILNLIKNAEDVLMEKKSENPTIKIRSYKENNAFILRISDNGGGIAEDIIDKIFDPYFSTKMKKNGTGLGLYMSKTIVQKHCGGKLLVHNDSEGAVFTIALDRKIQV